MESATDEAEQTTIDPVPPLVRDAFVKDRAASLKDSGVRPLPAAFRPLPPRPSPRTPLPPALEAEATPEPTPAPIEREASVAIEVSEFEIVAMPPLPAPEPQPSEIEVLAALRPRYVIVARTVSYFATFVAKASWAWLKEQLPRVRPALKAEWTRAVERARK